MVGNQGQQQNTPLHDTVTSVGRRNDEEIVLPPSTLQYAMYSAIGGEQTGIVTSPEGEWSAYCSIGSGSPRQRAINEDSMFIHRVGPNTIDIVVVDGMGGMGGGAVASAAAADTLFCSRMWELSLEDSVSLVEASISNAWKLHRRGGPQMGCAYAAVSIDEERGLLRCIHQGDVQVLIIDSDSSPLWLSREHSVGQHRADQSLPVEGYQWHSLRNYVSVEMPMEPKINQGDRFENGERIVPGAEEWDQSGSEEGIELRAGQRVVVASDGLFDVIKPYEVAHLSKHYPRNDEFLEALRELVKQRALGGAKDDNCAVAVYTFRG